MNNLHVHVRTYMPWCNVQYVARNNHQKAVILIESVTLSVKLTPVFLAYFLRAGSPLTWCLFHP